MREALARCGIGAHVFDLSVRAPTPLASGASLETLRALPPPYGAPSDAGADAAQVVAEIVCEPPHVDALLKCVDNAVETGGLGRGLRGRGIDVHVEFPLGCEPLVGLAASTQLPRRKGCPSDFQCGAQGLCSHGVCQCRVVLVKAMLHRFTGENCAGPLEAVCPRDCRLNGLCSNGTCLCDAGFRGSDCGQVDSIDEPSRGEDLLAVWRQLERCPNDCSGHGRCSMSKCTCADDWIGADCAQPKPLLKDCSACCFNKCFNSDAGGCSAKIRGRERCMVRCQLPCVADCLTGTDDVCSSHASRSETHHE